jgi:hypothetical protein
MTNLPPACLTATSRAHGDDRAPGRGNTEEDSFEIGHRGVQRGERPVDRLAEPLSISSAAAGE